MENFHVSESFKVLLKENNNPFERLSRAQFRIIRRRMIDCILATDMANHSKQMTEIKKLVDSKKIKNGENLETILSDNEVKNMEMQQIILSECVHTADLSNGAKLLDVFITWTDLVYREFFNQGDVELRLEKSISMLCDRKTTNINKSQIGFIKFVVNPQFEMIVNILPELHIYLSNLNNNLKYFENELEKETKNEKVF